jgi:Ni,Fe-hydrogenase maturation factor
LKEHIHESDKLQIISAESKPENIIGPIIRFQPDHLLLLDAVSGDDHGSIVIIPWDKELLLDTYLFSAPLSKFCTFIHNETGCAITLVGIQIPFADMSLVVSEPIQQTGRYIVDCFQQILKEPAGK